MTLFILQTIHIYKKKVVEYCWTAILFFASCG
jgi:hypothetical protein